MEGQNKAEKKVRKAMEKLNLKPVENVALVTMRRNPGAQIISIPNPQVYKASGGQGSETYLIYGKIGDADDKTKTAGAAAPALPNPNGLIPDEDDDVPALSSSSEAPASTTGGASSFSDKDIQLVMSQANVDREKAAAALKRNDGDIVNAIMELTMDA